MWNNQPVVAQSSPFNRIVYIDLNGNTYVWIVDLQKICINWRIARFTYRIYFRYGTLVTIVEGKPQSLYASDNLYYTAPPNSVCYVSLPENNVDCASFAQ